MKTRKYEKQMLYVVCGFVVAIIGFIIINIFNFGVYNLFYLIMLIFYFIKFLYLQRVEKRDKF